MRGVRLWACFGVNAGVCGPGFWSDGLRPFNVQNCPKLDYSPGL